MDKLIDLIKTINPLGKIIIVVICITFIVALILNFIIRKKYLTIKSHLYSKKQKRAGVFRDELLNTIVQEYKSTAIGNYNQVNTQAIIEKCFHQKYKGALACERFVTKSVSILIILGLLGTFLGLTLSVSELVSVLVSNMGTIDTTSMADILDKMASSAQGMGIAFITSLIGVALSIILNLLLIVFNCEEERENLMIATEEYLDNTVAVVVAKDKQTEYTLMNNILHETFVEFGSKIELSLKKTVEHFGDQLKNVVMDVNVSSKSLDNTVDRFDQSLMRFAGNIKDFSEFNMNLRNNIERMDVNFIKVAEVLKDSTANVSNNFIAVKEFSDEIKNAANEIASFNKDVTVELESIINQFGGTIQSFDKLGDDLKADIKESSNNVLAVQDRFIETVSGLGLRLEQLSGKMADIFSTVFSENSKKLSKDIVENLQGILKEILIMLDNFKENERLLAKTIAMLPEQTLTYNEAATANINEQLIQVKELLNKNNK